MELKESDSGNKSGKQAIGDGAYLACREMTSLLSYS